MPRTVLVIAFATVILGPGFLAAGPPCPEIQVENHQGAGTVVCPCFVPNEEAGAIFQPPAVDYPIEILRVGIGWGSLNGGNPDSLEQAINVYAGGLPDPGLPIATVPGPVLVDGFINEFDLEPLPGEIIVDSGPVTVTLEFFNASAPPFGPSMVHDGNGCTPARNVIFAIPGGWNDACDLGVTGDWVVQLVYRPACGPPQTLFIRGDANSDGLFNGLSDGLFMLAAQFVPGSPQPTCLEAADTDNSGVFNGLVDGLYALNAQFVPGSPPPPPPFPGCGADDDNALGCVIPPLACL